MHFMLTVEEKSAEQFQFLKGDTMALGVSLHGIRSKFTWHLLVSLHGIKSKFIRH